MLLTVNEHDPRPLYLQIVAQIKEQVAGGTLKPGDNLPGVRELGESLGINLHTVHRAYQKLRDEGVITLRLGRHAKIAAPRSEPPTREAIETALVGPLNELITEAFHLRLSAEDFRRLVEELLETRGRGRSEP